jgi:plasmid segregation protein ParM
MKLIDYYSRQNRLEFTYEGEEYSVAIDKVIVCPQCYSAIASRLGNMKGDYLVVDIGSKTTDVVYVQNGLPIESKSITIEKAMVKWIKEIQREMKVQTGKDIPEHEIMKIALKEDSNLPGAYAELIRGMLREKMHSLELELAERGYSMEYTSTLSTWVEVHCWPVIMPVNTGAIRLMTVICVPMQRDMSSLPDRLKGRRCHDGREPEIRIHPFQHG